MTTPTLSVVIPVYNEEAGLPALFARLYPALDALQLPYEVIFVNDGSRDRSGALLREQFAARRDVTRVVFFNANYGQHLAILAGFERVRGERIVTLDADLQNPPEEISKLLAAMDDGADYVGGVRRAREDAWWRRWASRLMNRLRERITRIRMTDQGCMPPCDVCTTKCVTGRATRRKPLYPDRNPPTLRSRLEAAGPGFFG